MVKELFWGFFMALFIYIFPKLFLLTKQTIYVDGYILVLVGG